MSRDTVSATIQRLARNLRLVIDYWRMNENSRRRPPVRLAPVGENRFAVPAGWLGVPAIGALC
ncbi:hypothetical protein [Thiocapsa bogorovii]|uniref:hypothetical protein n=1 Tax=Thiocapsa bogorovii TaxID=521689 RepID=UPI001E3E501A|nr:hypothetical protein [Thiocapsa bogorovii]UHD16687.1 hypothetical protein LT988_01075 [Thiocapsa bogorovii]